jgi:hypothetical protein
MTIPIMTVTIRQEPGKELRDICADIRARVTMLEDVMRKEEERFQKEQEKAATEHKERMDGFKDALRGYRNMLVLEEAFAKLKMSSTTEDRIGPMPEVKIPLPVQRAPLAEFFIAQIKEKGPRSKEELRQAAQAAGYFENDGGGRATHVTLANITRSRRLTLTLTANGDGVKYMLLLNQKEESLL